MADYFDVIAFVESKDGKKFPKKIGRLKFDPQTSKGSLYLDMLPIGWTGSAVVEEPRPYDGPPRQGAAVRAPF